MTAEVADDMEQAPAAVRNYFEALNREDWDLIHGLWAPDAELRAVGSRPRRGRAEVMGYFTHLFQPWREHRDTPTRVILAEHTVVVEVEFQGVSTTGVDVRFDAVDIFDLSGGTIARLSTWYDLTWLRKQL